MSDEWKVDIEKKWRAATTKKARNEILKPYLDGSCPLNAWYEMTSSPPRAGRATDRFYSAFTLNKLCKEVDLASCASGEIPVQEINDAMKDWQTRLKETGCVNATLEEHPFRSTRSVDAVKEILDRGEHVLIINPPRFTYYNFFGGTYGPVFSLDEEFRYYIGREVKDGYANDYQRSYIHKAYRTDSFMTTAKDKQTLVPPSEKAKLIKKYINYEIL